MRVSDERRVLFVHVPKAGGTTVDRMFDREVADARRLTGCSRHAGLASLLSAEPELTDYWIFGLVRNPWDRMVSWWSMGRSLWQKADEGNPKSLAKIREWPQVWVPFGRYRHDFEAFVLEGTAEVPRFRRQQSEMLITPAREADFVGRQENYDTDMAVVRKRLGLPVVESMPRLNKSSHGDRRQYYSERSAARVAELYADDIRLYDYTF